MKRIGTLGLVLAALVLMASQASALSITDDFTKTGFDIAYTLTYTDTTGGTSIDPFGATFSIVDSSVAADFTNGPWYITAVAFKFFEESPTIHLSGETGLTIFNPQDGFWGYTFNTPFQLGVGGNFSVDFTFYDAGAALKSDWVNFQVDYRGAAKGDPPGGYYYGQLSDYLTVPEPGTVLLLGSGLLGLVGIGRKFRK